MNCHTPAAPTRLVAAGRKLDSTSARYSRSRGILSRASAARMTGSRCRIRSSALRVSSRCPGEVASRSVHASTSPAGVRPPLAAILALTVASDSSLAGALSTMGRHIERGASTGAGAKGFGSGAA
jgi:hypothetical protein